MAHSDLLQSLLRALDILELVARSDDGLTLQELADSLGMKPPTVYNLARTLAARGFLRKVPRPVRYQLGPAMTELVGLQVDHALMQQAPPVMRRLFSDLAIANVVLGKHVAGDV